MIRKIKIGGEERPVEYNFNCLQEIAEITGIDTLNGLSLDGNFKLAIVFVYTGLKYGLDPEGRGIELPFDQKKVGSWLKPPIVIKFVEAFNSQCQSEEKKTEAQVMEEN
jgi:hypothetical protein